MKLNKVLLIALALLTFYGCKKYEEGPALSLRSKKGRISKGWKINEQFINGTKTPLDSIQRITVTTFNRDGSGFYSYQLYTMPFSWEFIKDKEAIKINNTFRQTSTNFYILKLKNEELWLEHESDSSKIQLRYVPAE